MDDDKPKVDGRDPKTGRFLTAEFGNKGGGRKPGARSRLGEAFVEALAADFAQKGTETIQQMRVRDPIAYNKLIAGILPREVLVKAFSLSAQVDLNEMAEAQGFLSAYRFARDRIGAVPIANEIPREPLEVEEGSLFSEAWRIPDDE